MELLGFLLGAIAIAFVIAKVVFSSKAKTPATTELPEDKSDDDSGYIDQTSNTLGVLQTACSTPAGTAAEPVPVCFPCVQLV